MLDKVSVILFSLFLKVLRDLFLTDILSKIIIVYISLHFEQIDVPHIKGTDVNTGEEVERISGDDQPFAALAFKIATDPFVGKLCYFRVYSGVLQTDSGTDITSVDSIDILSSVRVHLNDSSDSLVLVLSGVINCRTGCQNT